MIFSNAKFRSSLLCKCVVVVPFSWLEEFWGQAFASLKAFDSVQDWLFTNDRPYDQANEDSEQHKVEYSKSPDATFAKLGLLGRVNWRPDLATATVLA